ncbi:hypothetical protein ACFPRL_34485 [Pseudoclavibacter helvolus]
MEGGPRLQRAGDESCAQVYSLGNARYQCPNKTHASRRTLLVLVARIAPPRVSVLADPRVCSGCVRPWLVRPSLGSRASAYAFR